LKGPQSPSRLKKEQQKEPKMLQEHNKLAMWLKMAKNPNKWTQQKQGGLK